MLKRQRSKPYLRACRKRQIGIAGGKLAPRASMSLSNAALPTLPRRDAKEVDDDLCSPENLDKLRGDLLDLHDNSAPLHWAAKDNDTHIATMQKLIQAGANLEVRDCNGWTPLFYACMRGAKKAVRILIDFGANFAGKDNVRQFHCTACCVGPL